MIYFIGAWIIILVLYVKIINLSDLITEEGLFYSLLLCSFFFSSIWFIVFEIINTKNQIIKKMMHILNLLNIFCILLCVILLVNPTDLLAYLIAHVNCAPM